MRMRCLGGIGLVRCSFSLPSCFWRLINNALVEYAAAFFILADRLGDAVQVCINQLQDIQLAIAIARVYEGDDGPVFRQLLEERILPQAAADGNRWLASWAFWMLKRRGLAVQTLIVSDI